MSEVRTYKVGYINDEGKKKSFRFETDKTFRRYTHNWNQGVQGLGNPFVLDMMEAGMKHKGFTVYSIKFIQCETTGESRIFA